MTFCSALRYLVGPYVAKAERREDTETAELLKVSWGLKSQVLGVLGEASIRLFLSRSLAPGHRAFGIPEPFALNLVLQRLAGNPVPTLHILTLSLRSMGAWLLGIRMRCIFPNSELKLWAGRYRILTSGISHMSQAIRCDIQQKLASVVNLGGPINLLTKPLNPEDKYQIMPRPTDAPGTATTRKLKHPLPETRLQHPSPRP